MRGLRRLLTIAGLGALAVLPFDGAWAYTGWGWGWSHSLQRPSALGATFTNTNALDFDGATENITVPDDAALDFTTNFSVCFWMKWPGAYQANKTVVAKWLRNTQNSWRVFLPATTMVSLYIGSSLTDTGANRENCIISPGSTSTDWNHICFTYDGSVGTADDRIVSYLNGSPATTSNNGTIGTSIPVGTADLTIASDDNDSLFYGVGSLDEIGIWNSTLSAADVTAVYNGGAAVDLSALASASGLVAWYRMGDGESYPTIVDATGNGHDGTGANVDASDEVAGVP